MAAERSRILLTLLADVDRLAERGVAAIRAEIPAYAAQDDERFGADVLDQVARNYRTDLTAILEEHEVTLEDIAFVRSAAMRRARSGLALEDYIVAFRVGHSVLWDAVVEAAGETSAGHEAALSLATPLMRYDNFASSHAAHAYVEFQQYAIADADRERRDLLEHLLAGELPSEGPLLAAARAFGLGAERRMLVAVAVGAGQTPDADARVAASAAIARTGLDQARTLVVVRQAEIVAVPALGVGAGAEQVCALVEDLQARLAAQGTPLALGISTVAEGVGELPRAYAEARAALECVDEGGGVAALPRFSSFHYLALRADATAHRLTSPRVRAFLDEDRERGGVLTATIRAFADADLNLRAAADALQIHPNTAQYRVRRIEERTGLCLRRVSDLFELLVAIALDDARIPGALR
ncbi:MAG TPA: helix-turn-helix domain-containing protein [Solirubrobacteraceae bacterium]|nr:helix-turn-helix domain-containing protein [Solirubrobacteraceae bacterium]